MTPEELVKKYDNVMRDMTSQGDMMFKLASSALTFIKERVIEKGEDAEGHKYKGYSTKALLVGDKSFIQKATANKFFKDKETKWVTVKKRHLGVLPGGYKQLRDMQGRQTDHVDFSYTGAMWGDINVISTTAEHNKGVAVIGAKTDAGNDALAGNTERRGDILDLSKSEIDDLIAAYYLEELKIFKMNGL